MSRESKDLKRWKALLNRDLYHELPDGGWRRMLALWGVASVPFFRAFHVSDREGALPLEDIYSCRMLHKDS